MKRIRKILLLLIPCYLLVFHSPVFCETTTQKISDSIYVLTDKDMYMNSTLILGNDAYVLIDTRQNIPLAKELQTAVKSITDKPIKYLINTHYHGDHTFGNQIFKEAKDIIGHKNVRATLLEIGEQHKNFFRDYFKVSRTEEVVITPPTLTYEKELSLEFDNKTIKIFHLGRAHTNTDSFIYLPQEQLLITGDLFFNRMLGFTGDPQCCLRNWIKTLKKVERLDIKTVIPGHGPVGNKDDLITFRKYLEKLLKEVKREFKEGRTLADMKKSITLSEFKEWGHYGDWLSVNIETAYKELSLKK